MQHLLVAALRRIVGALLARTRVVAALLRAAAAVALLAIACGQDWHAHHQLAVCIWSAECDHVVNRT